MNWLRPEHIIAVGVALAAIGAIVSGAGTYWNTQRQAQKSEETKNLYKDLLGKSEEIADLNRKLTAANKQVSEILTGGDAFCHVNSIFITENGIPTLKLDIANSGTNPVHNVTIRIRDLVSYFNFFRDNPNRRALNSSTASNKRRCGCIRWERYFHRQRGSPLSRETYLPLTTLNIPSKFINLTAKYGSISIMSSATDSGITT